MRALDKLTPLSFPTGHDWPDDEQLQAWADNEILDGIGQKTIDACPWIPAGSTLAIEGNATILGAVFPSTIRRHE